MDFPQKTPKGFPPVLRGRVCQDGCGRLDQYLPSLHPQLSRRLARGLIDVGGVHVNGRRMRRCGFQLRAGNEVAVYCDELPLLPWEPKGDNIVFKDNDLLVLNKPIGLPSQPTPARYKGTVYQGVFDYLCRGQHPGFKPSIGMVQRLDKDTSGLMVFSVSPRAHKSLTLDFQQQRVKKNYLALLPGDPGDSGCFDSMLARRHRTNLVVPVEKGGKRAVTKFIRLGLSSGTALVAVRLESGRMHQIRAHFSSVGLPLVGDLAYGWTRDSQDISARRPMLHSALIGLNHPVSGQRLQFNTAPPNDFRDYWLAAGGRSELFATDIGNLSYG